MTREPAKPAAVRKKVESWLAEPDSQMVIALRARPDWPGDPVLTFGEVTARVIPCATPLAARAALHDRKPNERLVLLTELSDVELGDGLLAHVSRCTVRSIEAWDLVKQMFGLDKLDPIIVDSRYGGGRWIADALTEYAPVGGWPLPTGMVLTREHALRCLAGELLGLDGDQLDSAGLLQWSTDPHRQLRFAALPAPLVEGVTGFLAEVAGGAVIPIMAAVRAGHGIDAIALGLVAAALWPAPDGRDPTPDVAAARARLEPMFGGVRLTDTQAYALRSAAEAWVDRGFDAGDGRDVSRVLGRAETIAQRIDAQPLLKGSDLLPSGLDQRLRAFADAVHLATPTNGAATVDLVASAQRALAAVQAHRVADPARVEKAAMAVRALRWLSTVDTSAPVTLIDALNRQVRVDGWVDRARLDVFAGDIDPYVADAYARLHRAVDARRARHDQQFATLLAADTAADAEAGTLLRVEDVLERVIGPILAHGRRVLLLILDGMSVAASTELAESLVKSGSWLELTPDGGSRVGVLAALPTVTEVSRCSLLSGRIATGQQPEERAAFTRRFPDGVLLHKAGLRSGAGTALDPEVHATVRDAFIPVVAAVVNTVDDALDRGDPDTIVWSDENILAVRDLLAIAHDRVVVIVSDHGHVIDRGPDGVVAPSPSRENRWRPAAPPAGDGEIAVSGKRVALGDGRVVLPWREDLRYGPRKAGYHGGASAAEAVIPLIILAKDEAAVPGWAGAPVASPQWWREAVPDVAPAPKKPTAGRRGVRPGPAADSGLFDLPGTPNVPAAAAPSTVAGSAPAGSRLIEELLASDLYLQRKASRAPLSDERVAAMLAVLLGGGGRATMETLAARAAVPAHRIGGTVTALRKVLQIEGYPVLTIDPDGQTVKLDVALLVEQFQLGPS